MSNPANRMINVENVSKSRAYGNKTSLPRVSTREQQCAARISTRSRFQHDLGAAQSTGVSKLLNRIAPERQHYFHKVTGWSAVDISKEDRDRINASCSKPMIVRKRGKWVRHSKGKPYQLGHCTHHYRVELFTPKPEALRILRKYSLAISYIEIACDWSILDDDERYAFLAAISIGFVQNWQGKNERQTFEGGGMSTGRRKGRFVTAYQKRTAPITGEIDVVHIEFRMNKASVADRFDLRHVDGLLEFNHREFWKKHFRLYDINFELLGRANSNKRNQQRRRDFVRTGFATDQMIGSRLYYIHSFGNDGGQCVQTFIKKYGRGKFLVPVDTSNLWIKDDGYIYG